MWVQDTMHMVGPDPSCEGTLLRGDKMVMRPFAKLL